MAKPSLTSAGERDRPLRSRTAGPPLAKPSLTSAGERDRPHWLPRSAFPFQIRFADVGGMRIHYVDEGSGPALLLVSAGQWSFMFGSGRSFPRPPPPP